MAIRKSSNSGIPFGNTASRPASPAVGQPYFNGQAGRLELYTDNGWQNIVQETPSIASAVGNYYQSNNEGTFSITGTNFVPGLTLYAIGTNGVEYIASSSVFNTAFSATGTFQNLSASYEPYTIKVVNPSNLFGLLGSAFYINDSPVWSTSAGSLGSHGLGSVSIQLSATDDESDTITYSLASGSLPTGLTLSSSGLISGTNTADAGTYSFAVTASDGINNPVSRSFSISVPTSTISGGTLSSDATYYYRTFTGSGTLLVSNSAAYLDILVVGGGAGGSGRHAGGSGAGALLHGSTIISTGSYPITIGAGSAGAEGNGVVAPNGTATSLSTLATSDGGGSSGAYGDSGQTSKSGSNGGSGGGGAYNTANGNAVNTSTPSWATYRGNAGGTGLGIAFVVGGGGGGAGSAGIAPGSSSTAGAGGAGYLWLDGYYYAGGGGSGSWDANAGNGGIGGGGGGNVTTSNGSSIGSYIVGTGGGSARNSGSNGVFAPNNSNIYRGGDAGANTGGGGGGGGQSGYQGYRSVGGNGGSGIVVVRYTKASVGG